MLPELNPVRLLDKGPYAAIRQRSRMAGEISLEPPTAPVDPMMIRRRAFRLMMSEASRATSDGQPEGPTR
jgi:hypothetical protein